MQTDVSLSYDWSGAPSEIRELIELPRPGQDHFDHLLQQPADLVTQGSVR